jgi:cytochrome c553
MVMGDVMRIGLKAVLVAAIAVLGIGAVVNYSTIRDFTIFRTPVCTGEVGCIDQGWSDTNRNWWYTTSQGSRLLPLSWFKALETQQSSAAAVIEFGSMENLAGLGYLASPISSSNPEGLPVGFAIDHDGVEDRTLIADILAAVGLGTKPGGTPPMCGTFPETCRADTLNAKWVGMNCSACHTNEITYQGQRLRIEGAPTLADFQTFEWEMLAALQATQTDNEKFVRFAARVLGDAADETAKASLKKQLQEQIDWYAGLKKINDGNVAYGRGRLDAQGHILNKVVLAAGQANKIPTVMADAPASYPHIWNTSQQKHIQWNGIAKNTARVPFLGNQTDLGALIRNMTEVIGVFAQIDLESGKATAGYNSSARAKNLVGLERQLMHLQSPRWPADFPPLDEKKVQRGRALFEEERDFAGVKASCATCHKHMEFDDTESPLKEQMTLIGEVRTDVFLACNTFLHQTAPGNFAGQKVFGLSGEVIAEDKRTGKPDLKSVPTRFVLINSTVGTMIGKADSIIESLAEPIAPSDPGRKVKDLDLGKYLPGATDTNKRVQAQECLKAVFAKSDENILSYKARPLNGIWATAPYLHNGSVPTLYDLLGMSDIKLTTDDPDRPANAAPRPEVFGVGSRNYDPVKGGYVSDLNDPDNKFVFRVKDENGAPIPGNYNNGHDYGTATLSEDDRMALVEYMKSL